MHRPVAEGLLFIRPVADVWWYTVQTCGRRVVIYRTDLWQKCCDAQTWCRSVVIYQTCGRCVGIYHRPVAEVSWCIDLLQKCCYLSDLWQMCGDMVPTCGRSVVIYRPVAKVWWYTDLWQKFGDIQTCGRSVVIYRPVAEVWWYTDLWQKCGEMR